MDKRKLKVMFCASDKSGPNYHIHFLPLQYMHKYNLLDGKLVYSLDETLNMQDADMICFNRQYLPEVLMFVRKAKALGKIISTGVDDNVWNLPAGNPASQIYKGETLARYEQILREVDFLTTSTPYLKKLALKFNPLCYVERNLVEPFYNEYVSPGRDKGQEDTIRIGWWLTVHHSDDAKIIENVIPTITQKYPQVRWIMMGWLPPSVAILPRSKWEYYDFVPVDAFYPALASLDMDICMAPLQNNPFNWGKTGRKAQEAAILGIPMVLSPISTYSNWIHNETCIKPKTNDTNGWNEALSLLIENNNKREELAKAAYRFVLEYHDINTWIGEHAQIFYSMYNKIRGTHLEVPGYEDKPFDLIAAEQIQNIEEALKLGEN